MTKPEKGKLFYVPQVGLFSLYVNNVCDETNDRDYDIKCHYYFCLFTQNCQYSETCLNQTLSKAKTCLNWTLSKTKTCLNRPLSKTKICLNWTLSKAKTCLNQTDLTVPSTKCLCYLNLCKPNTCLNWTNSSVPEGFDLDRFYCIKLTKVADFIFWSQFVIFDKVKL